MDVSYFEGKMDAFFNTQLYYCCINNTNNNYNKNNN